MLQAVRRRGALYGIVAIAGGAAVVGTVTSAEGAASKAPEQSVIVVLKDQNTTMPADKRHVAARSAAQRSQQAPLQRKVRDSGGTVDRTYTAVNGFSATMSAAQVATLSSDPSVSQVIPVRSIRLAPPARLDPPGTPGGPPAPIKQLTTTEAAAKGLCPTDPATPMQEPEALGTTHATQAQAIADGTGVTVAYAAEGIDIHNPDFTRNGTSIFSDYQDFSGDGTDAPTGGAEAFGDVSSIAAQGTQTYDLNDYNPSLLPDGCNIHIKGVAPGADIVGLKVFTNSGFATTASIVAAVDYAVATDHVDVVNLSLGSNDFPDKAITDSLKLATQAAVAAGATVTLSSGDAGASNTIGTPAGEPGVITVGATTTERFYAQAGFYGSTLAGNTFTSDNISGLSSSGFTENGRTIDLVAPGDLNWAVCTPATSVGDPKDGVFQYADCLNAAQKPSAFFNFGGTSESAPLTAGAAADVIQAYAAAHGGTKPTPAVVKQILIGSADDLGVPGEAQGAGRLDVLEAVKDAGAFNAGSVPSATAGVVAGSEQLNVVGNPGDAVSKTVTVTNTSTVPQMLAASVRTLGAETAVAHGSVTFDKDSEEFRDVAGTTARALERAPFTVPAAADRLTFRLAIPDTSNRIRFALIDPNGKYTAFSLDQSAATSSGYSQITVRKAVAGNWTALIFASPAYRADVAWEAGTQDFTPVDKVTPANTTLAPGASTDLTVDTALPNDAGDVGHDLVLASTAAGATQTSVVPITLRTLVKLGDAGGTLSGRVNAGNGRAGVIGGSNTVNLDVPAGKGALAVALKLENANELVYGVLIDPDGQVQSVATNAVDAAAGGKRKDALEAFHADPKPGRWQFSTILVSPSSGLTTSLGYAATVGFTGPTVTPVGVPNSTDTRLAAGTPVTAQLKVVNAGVGTESLTLDPRTTTASDQRLVALGPEDDLAIPDASLIVPYLVPPATDSVTATGSSPTEPVSIDLYGPLLSPALSPATPGKAVSVTSTGSEVAPGLWTIYPNSLNAAGFGADPAPAGTVSTTMSAHTLGFDPDVDSSIGSAWRSAVDPDAPDAFPLTLAPGRSGTIDVTFNPKGADGTVVQGTLYVDTFGGEFGGGDVIAKVPYKFTIGTPAPATAPGPPGAPPAPPAVTVTVPGTTPPPAPGAAPTAKASATAKGKAGAAVSCPARCVASVRLTVSSATAKKAHLKLRTLGRTQTAVVSGNRTLTVTVTKAQLAALKRVGKTINGSLRVVLTPLSGSSVTRTLAVKFRSR